MQRGARRCARHRQRGRAVSGDKPRPKRRSIRLKGYDYTQPGAYFVTICVQGRRQLLGEIAGDVIRPSKAGIIVSEAWRWLGDQYPQVTLDEWIVMPNHLHGIIMINEGRGGSRTAPTRIRRKPLGRLVGAFKTVSTKRINKAKATHGARFWQRNYYERVIRDEEELNRAREYIRDNPLKWADDPYHPDAGDRRA